MGYTSFGRIAFAIILTIMTSLPVSAQVSYGVAGVVFPVGKLEVDQTTKLSTPTTIKIASYHDGFFVPTSDSAVPTYMGLKNGQFEMTFQTHSINVTWLFTQPDFHFEIDGVKYVAEKAGATIRFTESGVELQGVKKED